MCIPPGFESMHFNPFQLMNNTITQKDSDPDTNFYNDINLQNTEASYFNPDAATDIIKSFKIQPATPSLPCILILEVLIITLTTSKQC